jgi:G patch domain-containing protein 1
MPDENAEARESPFFPFLDRLSKSQAPKKLAVKKSSFGVGVLNDTGSDDEDPYELGPKITFNKSIGKEKKAKKPSKFAKAPASEKVVFVPKKGGAKPTSSLVLASPDGHTPLRGFVFATVIVEESKKKYPPPNIPPAWKSAKGVATGADGQGFTSVADAAKASTLDAKARASLLGETPLPGKSVFDYLSKEARDRIAAITGKTDLPQGRGEAAPEGHKPEGQTKTLWSFVPSLEKDIAAAALAKGATGWMPYAEDLKKRARYVGFLELRAGLKEGLPERPSEMLVGDWAKELQEFAHAAQVFKPTSGIMASRFTSASSSTQPASGSSTEGNDLLRTATKKPEDPAEQAAKLGMYGPMTRSEFPFHPSRLLCKRFNVPPPVDVPLSADPRADDFGPGPKTQEPVSKPELERMVREYAMRGSAMNQRPAWMNQPSEDVPMADAGTFLPIAHATVDVESNEALAKERAPDEVFKAIFGDSDDE